MKSQQIEAAAKKAISKFFDSNTMKGHQNPNGSQKLFQKKYRKSEDIMVWIHMKV